MVSHTPFASSLPGPRGSKVGGWYEAKGVTQYIHGGAAGEFLGASESIHQDNIL